MTHFTNNPAKLLQERAKRMLSDRLRHSPLALAWASEVVTKAWFADFTDQVPDAKETPWTLRELSLGAQREWA